MSEQWPPGWYPDPSGASGQERWWNGASWTAHARDSGAAGDDAAGAAGWAAPEQPQPPYGQEQPQPPYGQEQPGYASGYPGGYPEGVPPTSGHYPSGGPPPRAGSAVPWVIGGIAAFVGLVLFIGVGVFVLQSTGEGDTQAGPEPRITVPGPDDSPTLSPSPGDTMSPSTPGPDDSSTDRVTDAQSGLSYERLGSPWEPWTGGPVFVGIGSSGQYMVTQQDTPTGGQYIAQIFLGEIDTDLDISTQTELQAAAEALMTVVLETPDAYPPHTRQDVSSEPITVDGYSGWRVQVDIRFTDNEGYIATGERVDVAVIDTGKSRPAGVVASIPDNRSELLPDVDEAYRTLRARSGDGGGDGGGGDEDGPAA